MTTTTSRPVTELLASNPDYAIENGIPRQKKFFTPTQDQTADSFGFKWAQKDTYQSPSVLKAWQDWMIPRYSLPDQDPASMIKGKKVLDAGCGPGYTAPLVFGEMINEADYYGVDISSAVDIAKAYFEEKGLKGQFVQCSLRELPDELGTFDVIFSEGVLHHTDSTEKAIDYMASKLNPGGLFLFYVYNKKGPIREFTDDYIRERLAPMSNEEAWKALMPLSKLGKQLGELNIELDIEEPIDILDIPAGKINLQRLFYWHVFKAFHRDDWSLDEMHHVNFDWFHPANSFRQTPEQVTEWVERNGLEILKMEVEPAGITVVARKTQ